MKSNLKVLPCQDSMFRIHYVMLGARVARGLSKSGATLGCRCFSGKKRCAMCGLNVQLLTPRAKRRCATAYTVTGTVFQAGTCSAATLLAIVTL
jgi:hypothetical protein